MSSDSIHRGRDSRHVDSDRGFDAGFVPEAAVLPLKTKGPRFDEINSGDGLLSHLSDQTSGTSISSGGQRPGHLLHGRPSHAKAANAAEPRRSVKATKPTKARVARRSNGEQARRSRLLSDELLAGLAALDSGAGVATFVADPTLPHCPIVAAAPPALFCVVGRPAVWHAAVKPSVEAQRLVDFGLNLSSEVPAQI